MTVVKFTQNAKTANLNFRKGSSSRGTLELCTFSKCTSETLEWWVGVLQVSFTWNYFSSPVVVSDELLLLCGCGGRRRCLPSVLCDAGVRFDEHDELQIVSLVHLDRKAVVGQFRRQLRWQPDVRLVCSNNGETLCCHYWTVNDANTSKLFNITCGILGCYFVAHPQPAGMWLKCSPLLHWNRRRRCFLCLRGPRQGWSVCSVCPGDFPHWSEHAHLSWGSEDK